MVLGTPIGHDSFVKSYLHKFITDIAAQGDLLAKYANCIIAPFIIASLLPSMMFSREWSSTS